MRKVQHILWGLVGIGLLIPLEGCGTRPTFGKVSGTVTLDGQPLAGVTVYFLPKEGRRSFGITNKEGQYTPLADTIWSFQEICEGKWDHLPEGAFRYVGSVDQAEEQAKRMAR